MTQTLRKLGIVAGGGALPGSLIKACQKEGRPFFVLALKGHADPALLPDGIPMKWMRMGAVGFGFAEMKRQGAQDIVLIGNVRRPSLMELRPDLRGLKFFAKAGVKALGDDGLLRAVINEIEADGFKIVGADTIIPSLLADSGIFGQVVPTSADWEDIEKGIQTVQILGAADVGQAVIVQQGIVLSVEAIEGTAALIRRTGALKREGGGGVLVKMAKPKQERRVDLPTIGPQTVKDVYEAGLKGIAVEAGAILMADAEACVKLADKLGIFIVGIHKKEGGNKA